LGFDEYFRQYVSTLLWVLALVLIFYLPERLYPAEKSQPRATRIINLLYTPVAIAIIVLLQPLFAPLYSFALTSTGGGLLYLRPPNGVLGQVAFAIAFAVVWDVWSYWVHRIQHTSSFLWQTHKFHHTETALNSSTQARHHALSHVLLITLYLPVIAVFGPFQPHFVAVFLMFRLWGFVNHANVRFAFGPLTRVIAGPQWHRIHHSLHAEHFNRNFATFFPFIDILFGTYYGPRRGEYPATGLQSAAPVSDLREATVAPFQAWKRMAGLQISKVKLTKQEREDF